MILKNVKVFDSELKAFIIHENYKVSDVLNVEPQDLEGGYVIPALADIHTHSDFYLDSKKANDFAKNMGVEIQVGGLCGFHSVFDESKVTRESYEEYASFLGTRTSIFNSFTKLFEQADSSDKAHLQLFGINSYIFSNPITHETNLEEYVQTLRSLYEKYPFQGMSLGTSYHPVKTMEPELFNRFMKLLVSKIPTIYNYHLRNQNVSIFEAIEEAFEYHRGTDSHCHISHLKFGGATHIGKVKERYQRLIEMASKEDFKITWDAYPFHFACTTISSFLPESDSWSKLSEEEIVSYIKGNPPYDFENVVVACADESFNGKTLNEIAIMNGTSVEKAYSDVVKKLEGIGSYFRKFATLDDLNELVYDERVIIASDSLGIENVHPRCTHTYTKVIASAYDRGEQEFTVMVDKLVNGPKTIFENLPKPKKEIYMKFDENIKVDLGSMESLVDKKFKVFAML